MSNTHIEALATFLDASPTPYHAVAAAVGALEEAGFRHLDLAAPGTSLEAGARVYVREAGSLVAVRIGAKPVCEAGFRVVAAHTDSPNLRIKPTPVLRSHGYVRLGVEVYGGVTVATWTDRDLGIAGAVTVRVGEGLERRLVDLRRPLCRIPNLAIHLNRTVNDQGLKINNQTGLPAVLMLDDGEEGDPLRQLLAAELGIAVPGDILTWDLMLYDLTAAAVAGARGEFLHSARLDNLACTHAGLAGLLESVAADELPDGTAVLAAFDHEEIGSTTVRGARSNLLSEVLDHVRQHSPGGPGSAGQAARRSWLISADMAHAVHPGYADRHDAQHMPKLNAGPVIKQNSNWRYTTEAAGAAMFQLLCEAAEVPYQWFVSRSDLRCGSTVGPFLASQLGMPSLDVGNPMLSMHSAREQCGTADHPHLVAVFQCFFADHAATRAMRS
jgi:aspartyl aminopeptidase